MLRVMYWRQGIAKFKLHCIAVSILSNAYVLRVAYFILSTMYIDSLFSELCDTACQHMCITAWMGIQPQSSDVTAIIWFAGLPHAATLMKDSQRSNSSYHRVPQGHQAKTQPVQLFGQGPEYNSGLDRQELCVFQHAFSRLCVHWLATTCYVQHRLLHCLLDVSMQAKQAFL